MPIKHTKAAIIIFCFISRTIALVHDKETKFPQEANMIRQLLESKYSPVYLYKSILLIKTDPPEAIQENVHEAIDTIAEYYGQKAIPWL